MPEMNSVPTPLKPVGPYPDLASSSVQPPKLLDRLRETLRFRRYSRRTDGSAKDIIINCETAATS